MVRRKTAALAAAASAVGLSRALHVSRRSVPTSNNKQAERRVNLSSKVVSPNPEAPPATTGSFPTAKPDEEKPGAEKDLLTDAPTHAEEHRPEAESSVPTPPPQHAGAQAELDKNGYRAQPPDPIPFITASCEEICASDCAAQGFGAEVDSAYQEVMHGMADVVPAPVKRIVEYAAGETFDYIKELGQAVVPGMTEKERHEQTGTQKEAGVPGAPVSENKPPAGAPAFVQMGRRISSWRKKDGACVTACQAALDKCSDDIDSSDSIPEGVEEYTTIPQKSHCEDVTKLHFIAESGNLKWSMRFGQSPTFGQVAGLAEPFDKLTQADLRVMSHCAEGGDFASLNLGNAISLAKCMVSEVHDYAHEIAQSIESVRATDTDDSLNKAEMNPIAVDPVVEDENGEFHMPEEIFYVNDARCFSGCAGLRVQGVLENCEKDGHCATDFADLLWRVGALYAPTTMANAVNDMGYDHAIDPAAVPASFVQLKEDPALHEGEELQGTVDPKVAEDAARQRAADAQKAPEPETIPAHEDTTSPLYEGKPTHKGAHVPPFCKMQMCAPYPATWIHGDLLDKMYEHGTLQQCPRVEEVPDVHPHKMYDGAMPDPKAPEGSSLISVRQTPVHPIVSARKKAIERRQKTWAWSALKAGGYKGSEFPTAEAKDNDAKQKK